MDSQLPDSRSAPVQSKVYKQLARKTDSLYFADPSPNLYQGSKVTTFSTFVPSVTYKALLFVRGVTYRKTKNYVGATRTTFYVFPTFIVVRSTNSENTPIQSP